MKAKGRARWALIAFVAIEVLAFAFYAFVGRRLWFGHDELSVLASRNLSASDLLQQWGGHWIALPLIVQRVLFWAVGLRSFLAYQALTITLHLVAAALLRAIMLRAGVGAWVATATASAFVCFGSGAGDILAAFQITFDGALVLGLGQLLLADHDGPLDRRDLLGAMCGLGALMCSNVGVAMVVGVGVATLIRRGWRAAAAHTLPLGVVYAAWWVTHGPKTPFSRDSGSVFDWARTGTAGLFNSIGQVPGVGVMLAVMLVAGLVLGWRQLDPTERRQRAAIPVALLVGALVFSLTTGISRVNSLGVAAATTSRYMHILAALLIPALAFAANAFVRGRRELGVVAVALLLVGIPGNLAKTSDSLKLLPAHSAEYRRIILTLPRLRLAREVPRSLHPYIHGLPAVTVGWLLDGVDSGRFPRPPRVEQRELATDTLRLSLEELGSAPPPLCRALLQPVTRRLRPGEAIDVRGSITVQLIGQPGVDSDFVPFGVPFGDRRLVDVAGPLRLRIVPASVRFGPVSLCGAAP